MGKRAKSDSSIPLKITSIYATVGVAWIIASSTYVTLLSPNLHTARSLELIKGSVFVLATSLLIYFITNRFFSRLQQTEARLRHMNRLYIMLSETNQLVVRVRDRELLFSEICRITVDHGGFHAACIGKTIPEKDIVTPIACYGAGAQEFLHGIVSPAGGGTESDPVGTAVREGNAAFHNSLLKDPAMSSWHEKANRWNYRSMAAVPVRLEGRTAYVFVVFSSEESFFSEEDRRLLEEIGRDISFSLEAQEHEMRRMQAEERLRRNEALLKTIIEMLTVGVWIADKNGTIITGNPEGRRIWGGAKYVGIGDFGEYKAWHPGTGKRIEPEEWAMAKAIRRGEMTINEVLEIEAFDGTRKVILSSALPIRDDKGDIIGGVAINQDITALKQAEELLRRSNEKLGVLSKAVQRINTILDDEVILRVLISAAMGIADAEGGAAGRHVDGEMRFTEYNRGGETIPVDYRFKRGEGVPGHVMETCQPYLSADAAHDPHVIPEIQERLGFTTLADIPIMSRDGRLLGCFEIHNKRGGAPFGDTDIELLKALAAGAAIALENAEMLQMCSLAQEEAKATNDELLNINRIVSACTTRLSLQDVLEKALDEALVIADVEGGTICLLAPDETLELAVQRNASAETIADLTEHRIKVGECLCGAAAKELKPLILPNQHAVLEYSTREALRNENIHFHAAFPLVTGNRCVGVLCIFTRTRRKPSTRKLRILETVTGQVALAIENSMLYEQTVRHAALLEEKVAERTRELEQANRELEAFSFSVSHDLRAPLVIIDGYCSALLEEHSNQLSSQGKTYLMRLQKAGQRMSQMIEALLNLSRYTRGKLQREIVDISEIAREVAADLKKSDPQRHVAFHLAEEIKVNADPRLIRVVLTNLLGNAWKYTAQKPIAVIEFGTVEQQGETAYFVKDNGAGFDMAYAEKLFAPFQRLHRQDEFPGTGIGLATVQRIIHRHGGRIWADARPNEGATFLFTLAGF